MPVLWTKGVNTGRLTMNEFVAVTSTNIAKILNMLSEEGRDRGRRRRRHRGVGPQAQEDDHGGKTQQSVIDYNVFEGFEVDGPAALRVSAAARSRSQEGDGEGRAGPRQVRRRASRTMPVNRALSRWKEITAPRKVSAPASGDGGLRVRVGGVLIAIGLAALATPVLANAVLPLEGIFGNASGCDYFMTGELGSDDLLLLTPDTFTTYGTGCYFESLTASTDYSYTISALCTAEGEEGSTARR